MLGALGITFLATLLIGVPVAFCIGLSALVAMLVWGKVSLILIPQRMFTGVDNFVLMAIPFFMLAGELMGTSGILHRLLRFADLLVGHFRGGLAHVNIVSAMIFSGVSGSAVADVSALGSALIPPMRKQYGNAFASGVCAAAGTMGPIIPPSIPMVIYGLVANVSVAGLFIAGIIPGILIGAGMMVIAYAIARRRNYPWRRESIPRAEACLRLRESIVAVMMPLIIIGGILFGVVTPTEAGAIAVFYGLVVGFFVTRELKVPDLPPALLRSGIATGIVFILIATSNIVGWLITAVQLPEIIGNAVRSISDNPLAFLLVVNILLLIVGCFIDNIVAMIMLAPILAPIAKSYGIDPLHFGFIFVMNGVLGLLTPPFGLVLFVTCAISKISLLSLSKAVLPYLYWQIVVLLLCTYIPVLVVGLPHYFGFK
jgi:tripartite ATP-independent transporter DctM subunit